MTGETRPSSAGANWLLRMRWGALGIVAASILIEAVSYFRPYVPSSITASFSFVSVIDAQLGQVIAHIFNTTLEVTI